MIGKEFSVRKLARVAVIGRKEPVTIYEPMNPEEYNDRMPVLEKFGFGLHQFYQVHFKDAFDIFLTLADKDPPSASYVQRFRGFLDSCPETWEGVCYEDQIR